MILTFPVSYTIAKLLDYLLGGHKYGRFNPSQLSGLIEMHSYKALKEMREHGHEYECNSYGSNN